MCHTYGIVFVVERGRWFTPVEWEAKGPEYQLGRVSLEPYREDDVFVM